MPEPINLFLGFDTGGEGNFGWSICREVDVQLQLQQTGLANNAWDALNRVIDSIAIRHYQGNLRVLAAGIDAPLFWTRTGTRAVEPIIRQALRDAGFPPGRLGGSPQAINSLPGSVVVQGPLLVRHLRDAWPQLTITECYPTALEYLLANSGQHQGEHAIVTHLMQALPNNDPGGHQRDATLSAVSAWAAIHQDLINWQNLYLRENCPINPFDIPVSYWMPIPP